MFRSVWCRVVKYSDRIFRVAAAAMQTCLFPADAGAPPAASASLLRRLRYDRFISEEIYIFTYTHFRAHLRYIYLMNVLV